MTRDTEVIEAFGGPDLVAYVVDADGRTVAGPVPAEPSKPTTDGAVMTAPRTKDGRLWHLLEPNAYAAMVDSAGRELTRRIPGAAWIAFPRPGDVHMMFVPDDLDERWGSEVPIDRSGVGAHGAVFVGGEEAYRVSMPTRVHRGEVFRVTWGEVAEEAMA